MNSANGLAIYGLSKTYRGGVRALDNINLCIEPGMYGLLGPNGAGKSTLMRTLATLQIPDTGRIFLNGDSVLDNPDNARRQLGYLPQQIGAYPGVSARSLMHRFAWLKGRTDKSQRMREADALLEKVNLSATADRAASTYSGGMMRRLGIALALLGDPQLLIVDEPTSGLDPAERNRFHRVIADVAADSVVLLSTHIVEDIENLCGRLAILVAGRIVCEGTPGELMSPHLDRLWERIVPHGEPIPNHLHLAAHPEGTRVVVQAETAPDARFAARQPRLEDVYYAAVGASATADAA